MPLMTKLSVSSATNNPAAMSVTAAAVWISINGLVMSSQECPDVVINGVSGRENLITNERPTALCRSTFLLLEG
jgi:hypothetical protein